VVKESQKDSYKSSLAEIRSMYNPKNNIKPFIKKEKNITETGLAYIIGPAVFLGFTVLSILGWLMYNMCCICEKCCPPCKLCSKCAQRTT